MPTPEEPQYDSIAQSYASYDSLPLAKLEHELVTKAIGDCTGLTVLDLGGGNGQYARKAIELGAELCITLGEARDGDQVQRTFGHDDETYITSSKAP